MRLFIAVDLGADDYFLDLQEQFKKIPGVRMTFPSEYHITLKFLGDVVESKLEAIQKALLDIPVQKFSLECNQIGAFPNKHDPRVIWAGFSRGDLNAERPFMEGYLCCLELQRKIDDSLKPLGFETEKGFVPHVTLARVKDASPEGKRGIIGVVKDLKIRPQRFDISGFKLIKSTLSPSGPRYETVKGFE